MLDITVEKIHTEADFLHLRDAWNNLLTDRKHHSPFLSHEWYWSCWKGLKDHVQLSVLILRERDNIIAIAPFMRYRKRIKKISFNTIGFIENPDTQFADFITPANHSLLIERIIHYLLSQYNEWDILLLPKISTSSETYNILHRILKVNHAYYSTSNIQCPYISIDTSWDNYYRGLSTKFRKTQRNVINRLNKLGDIKVEKIEEIQNTQDILEQVMKISGNSWKYDIGRSIVSSDKTSSFFQELTSLANKNKWLLIWILNVNNQPVAMEYDLKLMDKVYALRADFNKSFDMYSPGSYLNYYILHDLFHGGYKEYHMGPGGNEYKWRLTDKYNLVSSFIIYNKRKLLPSIIYLIKNRLQPLLARKPAA